MILMGATSIERMTFKMSVDRMIPYRLILAQAFIIISFLSYGIITVCKLLFTDKITARMRDFPHSKIMIMSVIDTISFAGLVISAAGVTPTMTVILLHVSTPVIVFGSRIVFPTRVYSKTQMFGVKLISFAVGISLIRHISDIVEGTDFTTALCSVVYVLAAAVQGVGTLFKEKAIIDWLQPLDIHYLSTWLFFYQIVVSVMLAPFLYMLQGLSDHWSRFPINSFFDNLSDGIKCLHGANPPESSSSSYDISFSDCQNGLLLIISYVISNIIVLECIDKVLQSSNQILGRVMAASVFFAFIVLGIYDNRVDEDVDVRVIGTIGIADILSIGVLLLGIDYSSRDTEPDNTIITKFDTVEVIDPVGA